MKVGEGLKVRYTPILHSVSYAGVWPGQIRLSLDDFIDRAAGLGFKGVMLMAKRPHLSVLDYSVEDCARLREKIEAKSLKCHVIAGYNNFSAGLEHGDIPLREMQIQHVTELARRAQALGAGVVRIFTAYEHPAMGTAALWQLVTETLRECARRAAGCNVVIGVQNHHDMAVGHESMADLVEAVGEPNCRAAFDAWAPALHGDDIVEAAHRMGPITCHTTAADYQLRPRYRYQPALVNYERQTPRVQAVPMGDGFIDYRGFLTALAESGYRGGVAYEMCSPLAGGGGTENLDRCARRFLDWLGHLG